MASDQSSENAPLPALEAPSATATATKLPKIVISDPLKALLGDMLHANLSTMHLVLSPPNTRGKGDAMRAFTDFINKNQHELLVGKQTTYDSVSNWVKELKVIGSEELV